MSFWLGIVCLALGPGAASAQPVAVVAGGAEDDEVVGHLSTLEDVAARELALEGEAPHGWLEAAGALAEPLVVVIRRGESVVHVLRPADGTVLTRRMSEALARESAVACALVAAELIGVARQLSRSAAAPSPSRPAPAAPALERPPPEQATPEPARAPIGAAFGLGLAFTSSPAHDVSLVQGVAFAELHLLRDGPIWLAIGGSVSTPGTFERALGGPAMERAFYERLDLGLRVGMGFGGDATRAILSAAVGLSFVQVRALSQSGATLGEDASARGSVGLVLALRQRIFRGAFIGLELGGFAVPEPTRYLVRGAPAITEGNLRLAAVLALGWEV